MESSERLIEYYFQRRLKGVAMEDIRTSLGQQLMEEEDCDRILKVISMQEERYHQLRKRQRLGRYLIMAGSSLLLITIVILFARSLQLISVASWLLPAIGIPGLLSGAGGFFIARN